MNIKRLKQVLVATGLALATLVPATAFADRDRHWRPHHGYYHGGHHVVRHYNYVYYPHRQVYYAPHLRHWYWQDRGYWRSGAYLPRGYYHGGGGVNIVLNVDRPYRQHSYVVDRYRVSYPRHYRDDRYYRDDRNYRDRDRRWDDDD